MKTAEITRQKVSAAGQKPPGTWKVFADIYRKEGIRGINKGVNAVAIRQMTNWGSRISLSRLAEQMLRKATGKGPNDKLNALDKIACSAIGGGLSCWNQPIEVPYSQFLDSWVRKLIAGYSCGDAEYEERS